MHRCCVGYTLCRVHWLAVYHPWLTFDVLITEWVTCSTIVLGTSRAGSALLAVYRQWCSFSCGFSCKSVTCVCHGDYLLPGLTGFWVLFFSVGGCHMPVLHLFHLWYRWGFVCTCGASVSCLRVCCRRYGPIQLILGKYY